MSKEQLANFIRDLANKGVEKCNLFTATKHVMKKYPPTGCSLALHSAQVALALRINPHELLQSCFSKDWTEQIVNQAHINVFAVGIDGTPRSQQSYASFDSTTTAEDTILQLEAKMKALEEENKELKAKKANQDDDHDNENDEDNDI
jgi:hypothetical protein